MGCKNTDDNYIKFEHDKKIVLINKGSDFRCLDINGIASVDVTFQPLTNPYVAGSVLVNEHDDLRIISIDLDCGHEYRDYVTNFFAAGNPGRLTMKWGNNERYIDYKIADMDIDQNCVCRRLKVLLTLHCPDPYWNDMDDFGENLADTNRLLATPFVWLTDENYVVSYSKYSTQVALSNNGNVPIGVKLRIYATGTVLNPRINIGDEFIKVRAELNRNDILEISTVRRQKYVRLNGENILHRVDEESSFIELPVGTHTITWGADDGVQHMQIYVSRRWQYKGI